MPGGSVRRSVRPSAGVLQVRLSTARTMCAPGLLGLLLLLLLLLVPALPAGPSALRSSLGIPTSCRLSRAESELRCRVPGGKLCNDRGRCECGVCICQVTESGKYYGPLCECHNWVCETYDGKICTGHGKCDCGKCKCDEGWYGEACQYPTTCNLTRKKSNEMCKNSQDIICSGAGTCQCGRCKCANSGGNGLVYGKFCECDDRECIDDETGEICTGHGKCYCGNCYCEAGWHGDKCEFQCDITPWEIKKRCTSPDGKICSNRGTCVCGECTCHDVDPTGDWGDIHGDTCECDERNCKAVYDRYSDDFCSGHGQCNCGRCDCKEGWTGRKCEHPRSCPMSVEESTKKCQGNSNLPCSGRGRCECGQCTCFPPGDNRVHGRNCECDDRQCENADGDVCGGNGVCSCGRCICQDGWFGKLCQHSRMCNLTEEESRSLCESADGVLCSGKGLGPQKGFCSAVTESPTSAFTCLKYVQDQAAEDVSVKAKSLQPSVGIIQEELPPPCGILSCRKASHTLLRLQASRDMIVWGHLSLSRIQSYEPSPEGSCHCGKCICSAQEWYISGDFCECDDRDCDKHDGLICTGNGVCSCGNCECWEGWNGNACEIWLGREYP